MSGRKQAAGGESAITVVVALAANAGIAVLKAVVGALAGSAALLSEAAHSVADTLTEVLLLTALHRSRRPPDRRHPFGYGKERYFWSLIAALGILVFGAAFSFFQGAEAIANPGDEGTQPLLTYAVIAASAVLEGTSWLRSLQQTRRDVDEHERTFRAHLRYLDDPTVKSVLFEDTAALIGLGLALAGVAVHQATGSAAWEGVASIAIGLLLVTAACQLARTNMRLLIGQQADPVLLRRLRNLLAAKPEVDDVVDLLTMITGTDSMLLCARLDFRDGLTSADLERACVRIATELRDEVTELDEVFLEPVPRTDSELRARVLARYGVRPAPAAPDDPAPAR